jgi:YbgC/YbaW family acyl-CoA thioester hydrolase
MVTHTTSVKVRWGDTDPAGIVFYPRFFEWYDLGTETLFEALGLPWPEMFPREAIAGVPIVESGSTFMAPVRYGDVVSIRSTVAWVKEKTFRMEHEIMVGSTLCARGFEIRAWVARPTTAEEPPRARPIPEAISRRLKESR